MGKDQELLDAARNGNLSVVEKIVAQRTKKSGPLASLRRGPGANVQDSSGYTPLHHAALNGHKDVVSLLLTHEASTNIVDNKGSTALHLAAWTGNTEIVRMILTQGPVPSNVNIANHDRETPLHSAAQYGHTDVVSLLLQHNADPIIRNLREETPLDLAAQYGRLETVELLCRTHPELLLGGAAAVRTHSPLHLASRNGHRHVVQVLLRSGLDVNTRTDGGTALHEAALFGKVDVVRVLLDQGVELEAEDSRRRTVEDILDDLKTHISQEIATIIKNHRQLIGTDDLENANQPNSYRSNARRSRSSNEDVSPTYYHRLPMSPNGHCYQPVPKPRPVDDQRLSGGSLDPYQIPPAPRSLESSLEGDSDLSIASSAYQTPPPPRELDDAMSIDSYRDGLQRTSLPLENEAGVLYQVPPPPRETMKRMSDPVDSKSRSQGWFRGDAGAYPPSYIPMAPVQTSNKGSLKPPQKPPRKNMSPHSPTKFQLGVPGGPYEFLCMASSGSEYESAGSTCYYGGDGDQGSGQGGDEYVDMKVRRSYANPPYENHYPMYVNDWGSKGCEGCLTAEECDGRRSASPCGSPYETAVVDHQRQSGDRGRVVYASAGGQRKRNPEGDRQSRPRSLSIRRRHAQRSRDCPLSPTGYDQPPTPDFPPPSPGTAESGIHEKIRPLSQEYKRRSRDIETCTSEDEIFEIVDGHEFRSISSDNIELIKQDRPFAGLYRGSVRCSSPTPTSSDTCDEGHTPTMASAGTSDSEQQSNTSTLTSERPRRLRSSASRYSNDSAYENVPPPLRRPPDRRSGSRERKAESLSVMSPFDENEEWAKIADIMASIGGGISSHSDVPMSRQLEEELVARLDSTGPHPIVTNPDLTVVGKWLEQIGVPEYEDLLLANGFDHLDYLGGNMLEDQELLEIGILTAEHRSRIVASGRTLPPVVPINSTSPPVSVDAWLDSLSLGQYKETFRKHRYLDMDRVRKVWEVELTTVLEITRLGHKKRVLASLGERPPAPNCYENINELSTDLKQLKSKINQLNMVTVTPPGCDLGPNGTLKECGNNRTINRKGPAPQPPNSRGSSSPAVVDTNGNRSSTLAVDDKELDDGGGSHEVIVIRDPSQLFTGIPASLTTQWRHKPEVLISGYCNYTAQYLGSTLVRELKGVETSKKSIQKLKKSTSEIVKVPNIILSISFKGVKFIDAKTKNVVCEHEIRNIHCACQDADDLNYFAYITKDLQSDNHYCHVFSVVTMDMATEVILTLGQAFEVAYQMALKEKGSNGRLPTSPRTGSGVIENGFVVTKDGNKMRRETSATGVVKTPQHTLPTPDTRPQQVAS